jgi:hypothetical protein
MKLCRKAKTKKNAVSFGKKVEVLNRVFWSD